MEVLLAEDIRPAMSTTDMEDGTADPSLAKLADEDDSDDEDLLEFSLDKFCSQSTRASSGDAVNAEKAEVGDAGADTPQTGHGEPKAEEGQVDVGAAAEVPLAEAMEAESEDDDMDDYICPVVMELDELKWTRWGAEWRPCRLLNEGDKLTRGDDIPDPGKGHVYVELFPLKTETSLNNTVMVREDKLRPFNDQVEGHAKIWSPVLKAEMLRQKREEVNPRKRKKSIAAPKAKTPIKELQGAMNFAEKCLLESIQLIEEKKQKREQEEREEEEMLAAMGLPRPMDIEEQQKEEEEEEEEQKEESDEASTEAAFEERSRFRDKCNVTLRPGDIIKYKRDGAHMTEPAISIVLAVKPSNMKSKDELMAGFLVQIIDQSWLGPKDMVIKIKRAKPRMRHEDVPGEAQRFMKVKDHHLLAAPPQGWNMEEIETQQQAVQRIFAEGAADLERLWQQHFCNKPRKSKAPASEEGGGGGGADKEAAGSAGESKARPRAKTPPCGQEAHAD